MLCAYSAINFARGAIPSFSNGMLTSAVGAYYYLRVVVYMYMRPAPEAGALPERSLATELALVLSTVAVVVLGVLPGLTTAWLSRGGSVSLGR